MAFAYFKETLKNVFLQPAIIFVIVIQTVILLFIAFGISFEYQKDVLLSVSIMGREPLEGENLIVFRSMVLHFIPLFWSIFMFLYIIAISAFPNDRWDKFPNYISIILFMPFNPFSGV